MYKVITEVIGEVIGILSIDTEENEAILHYVSTHSTQEIENNFYKSEVSELSERAKNYCQKRNIELTYY